MANLENSQAQKPESRPYLLVGAGDMGKNYLKNLVAQGIAEEDISVVDIKLEKAKLLQEEYPGISVGTVLPDAPAEHTFVLSNTPAHLKNLEDLSELGTPQNSVLVEKPLVTADQLTREGETIGKITDWFAKGYTAYLIDFSPAMDELIEFLQERDLVVIQGRGNWEKNRVGNSRFSAGDLEDEMTHQLAALLALVGVNQQLDSVAVSARLQSLDFVNEQAQAELASRDASIPLRPNSATSLNVEIHSARASEPIDLFMHSSFTSPEQERVIQVVLSDGSAQPQYGAKITFDDRAIGGDKLEIWDYSQKGEPVVSREYPKADKLGRQIRAFLEAAKVGTEHPALKSLSDGLDMVRIAQAAQESHERRCQFVELDREL